MTTARVARVRLVSSSKVRVAAVSLTGTNTTPAARISAVTLTGSGPVSLQPFPDQTVEAFATVTLTATPGATSPTPTSYHWRQIPNGAQTVTFSDGGQTITFTCPPTMTSTPFVFGVVAYLGGTISPEATATVTPIPHLDWSATGAGWVALNRSFA